MKHKNTIKRIVTIMLCMMITLTGLAPQTVSAASYKKSVSKTVTVKSDEDESILTIKVKKAAKVTLTVKATKGTLDSLMIMHSSDCPCTQKDGAYQMEMYTPDGSKTATLELDLSKGSHKIIFMPNGSEAKLKVTAKAKKAVLGSLKWKK